MSSVKTYCFAVFSVFALMSAKASRLTFSSDDFVISFTEAGTVGEFRERESGRDLLRWKARLAEVTLTDGKTVKITRLSARPDGKLEYFFGDLEGSAVISVREEKWGIVFTAEELAVKDVREFKFLQIYPHCRKYNGAMINAMSDDASAVVLRTYELESRMLNRGNTVLEAVADIEAHRPGLPVRAALAASPRGKILERVKAMTADAGVLSSRCGGAWSREAPENRLSYLIGNVTKESLGDWISLAERGGFGIVSFYDWWRTLGHYETNVKHFPRGDADLKESVDRLHAAGLRAGMHTLTACIDFQDPWVRPECDKDLLVTYAYTLSRPFRDGDSEIFVGEKPGPRHDLVTSFLSNGNILRIGRELFTYTGIASASPYAFTGVKRAAYGTVRTPGVIPAGTKVEYLFQHFYSFFPEPSSPFMDEMARHLAALYSKFGFDFVYHDGAEPMSAYNVALTRRKFASAIDQSRTPLQVEASIGGAHSWWFHSRLGAWDHPRWAAKRFHDHHLRNLEKEVVQSEMLSAQAGWWAFTKGGGHARGTFIDEAEYFASRNAGADYSMSLTGLPAGKGPIGFTVARQLTTVGRYERFRLARAFTEEALSGMNREGAEFSLQQEPSGEWTLSPVKSASHRVVSEGFRNWRFAANACRRGSMRVEALYGAVKGEGDAFLLEAADVAGMKTSSAENVRLSVQTKDDPERGRVVSLQADNSASSRRGAWARASLSFPHPYRNISAHGGTAFGFWVKGDGSGAVLDFRVTSPRIFNCGQSDHFITLDFTGWRRVCAFLRERDAHRYGDYAWPGYLPTYPVFRDLVSPERIEDVSLILNDVPPAGRVEACVTPVEILRESKVTLENASVSVGGQRFDIPFPLESGQFAEFDDGCWIRYCEEGEPIESARVDTRLKFAEGDNVCSFSSPSADARAEITLFSRGASFKALKPFPTLDDDARKTLSYEACDPVMYAPGSGFDAPFRIAVRPGERARLEFEISGPVVRPSLEFRSRTQAPFKVEFPVDLAAGERLFCRDGKNWTVVKGFKPVRSGKLRSAVPCISGGWGVKAGCSDPSSARASINVVKRYR